MPALQEHLRACYTVCKNLADFYDDKNRMFYPENDFELGVQEQVLICLIVMTQNLKEAMSFLPPFIGLSNQNDSRAEFILSHIGVLTLRSIDPETIEPVATSPQRMKEIWDNAVARLDDPAPPEVDTIDYNEYARGMEQGLIEFREVVLPVVVEEYKELLRRNQRGLHPGQGPAYL